VQDSAEQSVVSSVYFLGDG